MAEVFIGTMIGAEGFTRPVAIKRVLPGLSQLPTFATMFVSEAQIASRLIHPNIVSVLDFSRDREDRLFLVMELVDGTDLARVLASGPIEPSLAIFLSIEMLRGLGYAHDLADPVTGTRGVIHRDMSPQNLLVSYEGAVKISDFGLAKVRAAGEGVRSDTVRGKPSYMSPEQCAGGMLDGRSDLYAVGVMLWEMLAHRPLFVGMSKEIVTQVLFKDIAPPRRSHAAVPGDVSAVAMKLLAREQRDRYPTADAAIEALLACADAPRDGRGELVSLLAERFPRGRGGAPSGGGRYSPGAQHARRAEQVTASATLDDIVEPPCSSLRAASPRRSVFAATVSGVVLGCCAAALVIARGEIAQSDTSAPAALPAPPPPADAGPGGIADSALPVLVPETAPSAPRDHDGGPPRLQAQPRGGRERIVPVGQATAGITSAARTASLSTAWAASRTARTGELAIIVRPWAMIWLNGKPRGQTPFRAAVPAGRYRVRLANEDVGQHEIMTVTVEPDQTATIERSW